VVAVKEKEKKFLYIILGVILLDQITKFLIRMFIEERTSVTIIPKFLYFTFLKNTGAGFSLFSKFQHSNIILIFTSFIIIGIILSNYTKIEEKLKPFFALILGGAIGNLIDRIFLGYVTDFFDFKIWPVFNIADSAISVSGIIILYFIFKEENKK
jgi:signal peptidase II